MAARILFVDDEPANLQLFRLQLGERYEVLTAGHGLEALEVLDRESVGVVLSDERMPGMRGVDLLAKVFERWPDVPRVIVSAYSDADRLLLAMNRGHAHEYVLKPWNLDELESCIDRCLMLAERRRALVRDAGLQAASAAEETAERSAIAGLVGASSGLGRTVEIARRAAASDATVLIQGETGTGKEFFAGFIHACSRRAHGPFVKLNCGALAEGVLESELFGHDQGAFTGAVRAHKGRFELADGGTIFLDEIGDLSAKLQVSLLRVLQERVFERVGGRRSLSVDVRIIAATHRDLAAEVRAGRFREDLFFRLKVIPLDIPPLRDRREDIGALVAHFVSKHARAGTTFRLQPGVLEALASYDWPGNVRELENVVQRAVVLALGDELGLEDFSLRLEDTRRTGEVRSGLAASASEAASSLSPREEARDLEAERLRNAIVRSGGNLARASRLLGLPRTTLASRAAKLGLL
jgi:DNA-binding NtrC family response regulator